MTYDGVVDDIDVIQVRRYIAGKTSIFTQGSEQDKADRTMAANVYEDTAVDDIDALQISRYVSGKISIFDSLQ